MELYTADDACVFVDDFYAPVLMSHWYGVSDVPAVERFARWHDAQIERARVAGKKIVLVSDARFCGRPTAEVRKFFADWAAAQTAGQRETLLGILAVVPGAAVRGALTVIGWVSEDVRRVTPVATVPEAIEKALAMLDAAGIERPAKLDPATYASPCFEAMSRGA